MGDGIREAAAQGGRATAQAGTVARGCCTGTGTRSGPCQAKERSDGAHDRLQLMILGILGIHKSNPVRGIVADNQQHCICPCAHIPESPRKSGVIVCI